MKLKFEVKEHHDEETDRTYNAIFIDDDLFDWAMEPGELERAAQFCKNNPLMAKAVHGDIKTYFLKSLSTAMEREVTLEEVNEAIEKGWINGDTVN